MGNVINLDIKEHAYEVGECAGCQKVIHEGGPFTKIGLPVGDTNKEKIIALCDECTKKSEQLGII